MSRTIHASAVAVIIATVFTTAGLSIPPTDGITATCSVGGESVVTGFKGNPTRVDFIWRSADGYQADSAALDVGGKYGKAASQATPTAGYDPRTAEPTSPWTPETLSVSVIYKDTVGYTGDVTCS